MVQPKPEAQNTAATYHGAFDYGELRRLGFSPDEVTDFSVNSNPHGPIPGLGNVLAQVPLDRYPDRDCIALREKLAGFHQTTIEHIVCGNGTTELLLLIANAFVRPGDKALILGPTFGEYSRAVELAGGSVATKDVLGSGTPDQSAIGAAVQRIEPRLVFLCHPNNPTGYAWPVGTLVSVAEA
ncbi:MAG: aminotransferase class I/II-fold pyridoxal phosphate-dependent enzyme, partial [Chloroflexota bacterium]